MRIYGPAAREPITVTFVGQELDHYGYLDVAIVRQDGQQCLTPQEYRMLFQRRKPAKKENP